MKIVSSLVTGILASIAATILVFMMLTPSFAADQVGVSYFVFIVLSLLAAVIILIASLLYGVYKQTKDKSKKDFSKFEEYMNIVSIVVILFALVFLILKRILHWI